MSTVVAPPTLLAHVAVHHDYVWARLPFVVPMALAAARRRGDQTTHELARLIVELRPLLLDHMDREEALLVRQAAVQVTATRTYDGMHVDHVAVIELFEQIRKVAGDEYHARHGAELTERALYSELARLDEHVHAQILLEEHLMAWRQRMPGVAS